MDQTFMKERKILPLVLSMSLPMVISMAVNSLYNIVDSYFVAKLSEKAMTALALVYPIQNLMNAIAIGFGIGINANVSYYLGAGNKEKANNSATQGIVLSFVHGVILTIGCIAIMPVFLGAFSSDQEVVGLACIYSNRAFMFSVISALAISFEKIFQSTGNMKVSMFSMMCGFITNIILDPLMIFGIGIFPAMGMAGAAYATGAGQGITLLIYLLFYFFKPIPVKIKRKYLYFDREVFLRLYSVGIPATLNMALPSLLVSSLNGILAGFSEKYVLVLGVYYKLQTFIYLTANGIIQGIRPLVGYNYGAGEYGRVKEIYKATLKLTMAVMLAGTILSWGIPDILIGLFTENAETVGVGVEALHRISLGFVVSAVSVSCSGALEGLGKGLPSLYISLARYVVIMIPAAFLLSQGAGANGVWLAFCLTEFLTAAFAYWIFKKQFKISQLS